MATPGMAPPVHGHRRNKSAVLRSIITSSKGHKRTPTDGGPLSSNAITNPPPPYMAASGFHAPLLPPDHPHSQQLRAGTQTDKTAANMPPPSPRKSQSSPRKSLNKKTLSAVSLRSLARKEEKPRATDSFDSRRSEEEGPAEKPKRPKSSSNLATMFGKRRDKSPVKESRDKENTTPPRSAHAQGPPRTPIWAEFSSQQQQQQNTATAMSKVPLNDQRRSVEEEIALYTPREYSPTKQRNFFDYGLPALRPAAKERPKSMVVPKTISTASLLETFSRKKSGERFPLSDTKGNEARAREPSPSKYNPARPAFSRASTDTGTKEFSMEPMAPPPVSPKKQNRVMAAVAAFNGKSKQADGTPAPYTKPDPKVVDAEFEEVLVSAPATSTQSPTDHDRNPETSPHTSVLRCGP